VTAARERHPLTSLRGQHPAYPLRRTGELTRDQLAATLNLLDAACAQRASVYRSGLGGRDALVYAHKRDDVSGRLRLTCIAKSFPVSGHR
jgi:hypothetical protein